jgi:hypothetical protein
VEGLGLPRLWAARAVGVPSSTTHCLLREHLRHPEEIAEDMRYYALKRDALWRDPLHEEEANAWRALIQLLGER